MPGRVDADIEKILPLLPLKDAANLTPQRAREELTALADSRKDLPVPQPAAVADITIRRGRAPSRPHVSPSQNACCNGCVLPRRRLGGGRHQHP